MVTANLDTTVSQESRTVTAVSHMDHLKQDEGEEISLGTESITLTTDDEHEKDETKVVQYDEEDTDEYFVPGLENTTTRPEYTRMNLKGDSESDKDLIIYSLNESLQIHKEMVERVQSEKDDIEYQYELDKAQEKILIHEEKEIATKEQQESTEKVNKLDNVYQNLIKELEIKKLDYDRMESKFHSHVKDIKEDGDIQSVQTQINGLLQKVTDMCAPLSEKATSATLDYFFKRWPDMMDHYFENEELDLSAITLLTEKMIMETIMHDILQTPIHPGITLNRAFDKIHHWVKKRNTSWASRIRQQICAFLVKQSNEEAESIQREKQAMIQEVWKNLCLTFHITSDDEKQKLKLKWTEIIEDAFKLNVVIKCQDNIEILQIEEGDLFNESLMKAYSEGDTIAFVISPPFVASSEDNEGFLIPAKVYCV